jgi:hypothetical protein
MEAKPSPGRSSWGGFCFHGQWEDCVYLYHIHLARHPLYKHLTVPGKLIATDHDHDKSDWIHLIASCQGIKLP